MKCHVLIVVSRRRDFGVLIEEVMQPTVANITVDLQFNGTFTQPRNDCGTKSIKPLAGGGADGDRIFKLQSQHIHNLSVIHRVALVKHQQHVLVRNSQFVEHAVHGVNLRQSLRMAGIDDVQQQVRAASFLQR